MKYSLCLLFILAVFSSCSSDKSGIAVPAGPVIDDTVELTFSEDIVPILQTYCYGTGGQKCHVSDTNQGASGDFTTCSGLVAKVNNGSLSARVFDPAGGMPPSYSFSPTELTDTALQTLELWVAQGNNCN